MISEETYLNEKDMLKFDKEIKFVPLTFDFIFKGVFLKNLDIFKEFILDQLELEINDDCNITLLNNELLKENKKEYSKTIDIYIRLNDDYYINCEINREKYKNVVYRNFLYFAKLCSMLLESGKEIKDINNKTLIQININANENLTNLKDELIFGTKKTILFNEYKREQQYLNFYLVSKYIDYYRDLYYNKNINLSKSNMWLVMLSSQNFKELYNTLGYLLNDKDRDKFIRRVKNMCSEYFQLHEWEKEKCQELVEYTKISNAKKEGIKEKEISVIKNMLENNFDYDTISKITNLSIEEIIKIKKSL